MSDHVDVVRYVMVITMCAFGGGGLFFSGGAVRDRGDRREDATFWIIDSEIARLEFAVRRLGLEHAAIVFVVRNGAVCVLIACSSFSFISSPVGFFTRSYNSMRARMRTR
jgi:hypothetical protein